MSNSWTGFRPVAFALLTVFLPKYYWNEAQSVVCAKKLRRVTYHHRVLQHTVIR